MEIVINNIFGKNLDEVLEKKKEVEKGDKTVPFCQNGQQFNDTARLKEKHKVGANMILQQQMVDMQSKF